MMHGWMFLLVQDVVALYMSGKALVCIRRGFGCVQRRNQKGGSLGVFRTCNPTAILMRAVSVESASFARISV